MGVNLFRQVGAQSCEFVHVHLVKPFHQSCQVRLSTVISPIAGHFGDDLAHLVKFTASVVCRVVALAPVVNHSQRGAHVQVISLAEDNGDLFIPMLGSTDSLNVSISAAVFLFEARAQKNHW